MTKRTHRGRASKRPSNKLEIKQNRPNWRKVNGNWEKVLP